MNHGRIAISAIGYDERDPSGLNRYTAGFLRGLLRSDADLVAFATSPALQQMYGDKVRLIRPRMLSQSNFKGNLLRLGWYQLALPRTLRREGAALFYSAVPEGLVSPPCSQVITIHDVLPLRFPEVYPRLKYYFHYILPRIIHSSSAIIVNSEATASDVREYYRVPDATIHVVYPGYERGVFRRPDRKTIETVKAKYKLDSFVLSVGETRPYKNIRGLIEAFARVPEPGLQLAIVGKSSKMDPNLAKLPRELAISEKVSFLGYVPDAELAALYSAAQAFVFPSLHEGFGFPALEAMACGCPVVASTAGSIPEVCGDAAVYVDPTSAESITTGIHQVATDHVLQRSLGERGLQRAVGFSYDEGARKISEILTEYLP